jgi:ankyrin repeat protein
MSLLHAAFEGDQVDVVRFLMESRPTVCFDVVGRTPAGVAVEKGHLRVLQVCDPGVLAEVDGKGRNLMHIAAKSGFVEIMSFLKGVDGIDVNRLDGAGFSPLHYAAEYNHPEIIRALLEIPRIDRQLRDRRGDTAMHVAATVGAVDALIALISRNPDENVVKNKIGRSPFFVAVANGQIAAVQQLIRAGADSEAPDQRGITIRDVLKGSSSSEIAALLDHKSIEYNPQTHCDRFYEIHQNVSSPRSHAGFCNVS